MKKIILLVFSVFTVATGFTQKKASFVSVTVDTVFKDKISIRAIVIDGNIVWYAADKGRFGSYNTQTLEKFQSRISDDPTNIEFRCIAKTPQSIFLLNIGNPAIVYKVSKDGKQTKTVYRENNEKIFYDSMQFRNDREGIAVGDPIDDCFSLIITQDGGNSWQKIPCAKLPKISDGEAAFAASNSNIFVKGKKTWIVSGGKKARVFYSPDDLKTWTVSETPIVQGLAMTGIFTADFYDDKTGFVAGGNYEIQNQNFGNKAITYDGGKSWTLVAENQGFGYASCVQFIPGSAGKQLVCVGSSGLQYSADSGNTWKKLLDTKDLYTIRFLNASTAIAAGRNCLLELHFK